MAEKPTLPKVVMIRSAIRLLLAAVILLAILFATFLSADAADDRTRIVLIGATAASAGELIDQALAAGHEVIGVSRKPETLEIDHENFTAAYGDVYKVESIEALLSGNEVVVSYIDVNFPFGPEIPAGVDLFSRGTSNIITAMKNQGNRRLFVASNMAAENVILDKPGPGAPMSDVLGWNRRHKYTDARLMETIVEASELDYTILRLPHLVDSEPTGEVTVVVNQNSYNIAVKNQTPPRTLTLGDLSGFILEQMNLSDYVGVRVGLFN